MRIVIIGGTNWIGGMISAYLVPFEGVVVEGMMVVVFGRLWSGNGIDNDKGVVSGDARIERHLWRATANMKIRIIVSFSCIDEDCRTWLASWIYM